MRGAAVMALAGGAQPTFHSEATQYDAPLSRVDRRRDDPARHGQRWDGIMQFHLNGFEPGDPEIFDPSERYPALGAQGSVPEKVDVLIIGCGPAGLTLAAQLSAFPEIKS